jgi:hypothetical protein
MIDENTSIGNSVANMRATSWDLRGALLKRRSDKKELCDLIVICAFEFEILAGGVSRSL